jgi:phage/plasmid primase-like uncharacterized protein
VKPVDKMPKCFSTNPVGNIFHRAKEVYGRDPTSYLRYLIPGGKIIGNDYVVQNPCRDDQHPGSFKIDIPTGMYNDFSNGDSGGDIIDLAVLIKGYTLKEAAEHILAFYEGLSQRNNNPQKLGGISTPIADTYLRKDGYSKKDFCSIYIKSIKASHIYLSNKKINIGNAKVNIYRGTNNLTIPLTDNTCKSEKDLEIKALQFINEKGEKRFLGKVKGLFHIASPYNLEAENIIVCEGYATAMSICEAIGAKNLVIASMSAWNMKQAVNKLIKIYPNTKVILAGDNDDAGRAAVKETLVHMEGIANVSAIFPCKKGQDFNDMLVEDGINNLKEYIKKHIK